jgi:hypothetical protein
VVPANLAVLESTGWQAARGTRREWVTLPTHLAVLATENTLPVIGSEYYPGFPCLLLN